MRIESNTMNGLVLESAKQIINTGSIVSPRNKADYGNTYEVDDCSLILKNPRMRHTYLYGRTANIFAALAELLWVVGGTPSLDPVMTKFLPRCKDFSDDGVTWRGAYNTRIKRYDHIGHIMGMFKEDGINTRRACYSIWQPDLDSISAIEKQIHAKTKDMPCSNFIWVWCRNNKVNLKLGIRSNDLVFGMSHINVLEFTFLQEVYQFYINQMFGGVDLGYYHHSPISLHIYSKTVRQVKNMLTNPNNNSLIIPLETFPILLPECSTKCQMFFDELYSTLVSMVYDQTNYTFANIFDKYGVSIENNILFSYCELLRIYLNSESDSPEVTKEGIWENVVDNEYIPEDLKKAVSLYCKVLYEQ